jgi:hypothetical protein
MAIALGQNQKDPCIFNFQSDKQPCKINSTDQMYDANCVWRHKRSAEKQTLGDNPGVCR